MTWSPQNDTSKDALKSKTPVENNKSVDADKKASDKNMKGSDCGC
ncbi:MAG: hypothetical protein JWR51_4784 [Devosia sp.]|nr:hypothetical protein [Devosia sp.]MDB5531681.1 hypothetical protein [Devosia sp.]